MQPHDVADARQGGNGKDPGKGSGGAEAPSVGAGDRFQPAQRGVDELTRFRVGIVPGVAVVAVGRLGGTDLEVLLALGRSLVNLLAHLADFVVVVVVVVAVAVVLVELVLGGIAREAFPTDDGGGGVGEGVVVVLLEQAVVGLDGAGGIGEDPEVDPAPTSSAVGTDVGGLISIAVAVVVIIVVVVVVIVSIVKLSRLLLLLAHKLGDAGRGFGFFPSDSLGNEVALEPRLTLSLAQMSDFGNFLTSLGIALRSGLHGADELRLTRKEFAAPRSGRD
mmetsp:Transcript_2907/g.6226  ORF Transcript_2907/g.6226 Transcript_2907/m.6226 type:complete len:277 (-) Transcript_2907:438-1268(-)